MHSSTGTARATKESGLSSYIWKPTSICGLIYRQLNDLRLTLPRIVEPFHMPSKPPMFHAFKDTLVKSQRDMKTFKALWQSPETQDILEHTRKSATANPDLSEGAQVPQYGWIEKEAREKEAEKNKGEVDEVMEDTRAHISKDERERVLAQWKKTNPLIKVEEGPEGREIRISFAADSTKYRFRVVFPDDVNATSTPKAECEGVGEPFAGVTRCLASRPNLNDLKYLLVCNEAHLVHASTRGLEG